MRKEEVEHINKTSSTVDSSSTQRSAGFTFAPRILEHLGISAYNSVRKCLGELVANAYDADSHNVRIALPDVIDENAYISIADDGNGMTADDLAHKFLYIGRDRRQEGERTPSGRLVIGSKGIGKLAGFGIASRVRLTTRRGGLQSTMTIDKSDLESIGELTSHKFDINVIPTEQKDGTIIELLQLHPGLQLPVADTVRRQLHRSMPSRPDFTIFVNDIECTAEDVIGEKHTFTDEIEGVGNVTGFYVVANVRQATPGLAVRVRGRIVQEASLFGLDTRAHGFFTAEKIIGEINAEFLDPESYAGTKHDLIKTSRDGFLEDSDIVQRFEQWAGSFVKRVVQGVDATEIETRTNALLEAPDIKVRLDSLPPHLRGTAASVVKSIIAKLKTDSDEDAKGLVEWILRYYESNVLKELMKAIASVDIQEAERLASLVSDWGLTQLNSVAGIVETQINIIGRLEELTISNQAYEIDLHRLIESNLWLVREGLELWSSDKPLKTLLEGRINDLYKDKEELRPDLVCRSRDEGTAVILEFKRPKEKVTMEHLTQAMSYKALIQQHRPNIKLTTYIVGREYDPVVLAIRDEQAHAGYFLWSFEDILQKSRTRFEKILEILGR